MSVDAQARFRYTQQAYGTNMPVQAPPPTMSSQRFCLRWNNHQSNLLSVFDQLLHDESFVDVTLAVEGQLLRAHKMVLSACSPYFQALFVSHPDKHPIVILKDVPYADMRSLLDFMYRGEVSVDQDRLTAFLRVAESLRIKGLTEVNEDKGDLPSITSLLGVNNLNNIQNSNRMTQQQQQQQQAAKRSSGTGQMMSPSLLGNALAQPKRKRGRPRKLSGSSNGSGNDMKSETDLDGEDGPDDDIADDIVKEEPQEQPTAGTSREQENYTNNDYQPESCQSSSDNNRIDTNSTVYQLLPVLPYQISAIITPQPTLNEKAMIKNESVIISTERVVSSRSVPVIQAPINQETLNQDNNHYIDKNDGGDDDDNDNAGVHFLTDDEAANTGLLVPKIEEPDMYDLPIESPTKTKNELLEYVIRNDGSVMCKVCGQILASRTHWYRHKYKVHIVNPAPLLKCHRCNVFFKSRRGYIGHLHTRHPKKNPVTIEHTNEIKSSNNTSSVGETIQKRNSVDSSGGEDGQDWDVQRERDEKLVADIIDRVRKECEAQGTTVTRRGYCRRQTVMNS